jgi:DHA2 family multidrug resistance protein
MDESETKRINPWLIAVTVMLPTIMEVLDTSIVNVALPHMQGSFAATQDEITWVLTSYLVANGIVIPMTGWLGRVFGRKFFLMGCVAIFTSSSFMCGISTSLSMIVVFRSLQGMSGGALQPISQAILLESFAPAERGMAMALWGVGIVTAPVVAPLLGGWITDNFTWRWVFYINIPIGFLALFMINLFIFDPSYARRRKSRIDELGIIFLALAIGCLQVILDKGQREDWFSSRLIITLTGLCIVGFVGLIIRELLTRDPVVDLRAFKDRTFASGTISMFLFGFGIYAIISLIPLYVQNLLGYSAVKSGLVISPRGIGVMIVMFFVGWLLKKIDARWVLIIAMPFLIYSSIEFASLDLQTGFFNIAWPNFIQGIGLGFVFVPLATATMSNISQEKMGNATGIFNLGRNIGGSIGIATTQTFLVRFAQAHQNYLVDNTNPYNPIFRNMVEGIKRDMIARGSDAWTATYQALSSVYNMVQRQAAMMAYIDIFWIVMVAYALMLPFIFLMKPKKGEEPTPVH